MTGGRQGLGLASARALVREGFDLVIVDLQERDATAEAVLEELSSAGAATAYLRGDISDVAGSPALADAIWGAHGRVDCLVDNAGIPTRPLVDVLDVDVDAFDRVMNVNVRGTFFLTQEIAKRMLGAPDPQAYRSIIVVTSIAAALVSLERPQYCISKAALSMAAQLFAVRLAGEGIAVHEVRPGFIETETAKSAGTAIHDEWVRSGRVPARRWGRPEDIGNTVGALASGRLPYVTGQPIWVAGGLNVPLAP